MGGRRGGGTHGARSGRKATVWQRCRRAERCGRGAMGRAEGISGRRRAGAVVGALRRAWSLGVVGEEDAG